MNLYNVKTVIRGIGLQLLLLANCPSGEASVDLNQAYRNALLKTPAISLHNSRVEQSSARLDQARGVIFPQIKASANYNFEDSSRWIKLTASQTLFQGLAEFRALSAGQANLNARTAELLQEKLELFTAVAQSFYQVISFEKDLFHLKNQELVTRKRIQELQSRVAIGRSRKTDLLFAQSQESILLASIEAAKQSIEQARIELHRLTDLPFDADLQDSQGESNAPFSLDRYIASIEKRGDIQSFKYGLEEADNLVGVAKAGHWPTLSLTGDYFPYKSSNSLARWDLTLGLTFPIFEGGTTQGKVKESLAALDESKENLRDASRRAEAEIRTAYSAVSGQSKQILALEEGLKLSQQTYDLQVKDYRFGLTTNLEVFQSLNTLYETQRSLDRAKFQLKASRVQLEAAVGNLREE